MTSMRLVTKFRNSEISTLSKKTFSKQKQPPEVFYKKGVLRNFTKFIRKHLCLSLFFNKVAGLRPAALLKKRLWHRCFPVNFVTFLITPFLQNTPGRLLPSKSKWIDLQYHFLWD